MTTKHTLFALLFTFLFVPSAFAATTPCAITDDIQSCIDRANNGDIIQLAPGEYILQGNSPFLHISKSLTLRGAGITNTTITANDTFPDAAIIQLGTNGGGTIENLTISHAASAQTTFAINVTGDGSTIRNIFIENTRGAGTAAINDYPTGAGNTFENITISGFPTGINTHGNNSNFDNIFIADATTAFSSTGGITITNLATSCTEQNNPLVCSPPDTDGDTITDTKDNCPNTANKNQKDTNHNGIGDACTTDASLIESETWSTDTAKTIQVGQCPITIPKINAVELSQKVWGYKKGELIGPKIIVENMTDADSYKKAFIQKSCKESNNIHAFLRNNKPFAVNNKLIAKLTTFIQNYILINASSSVHTCLERMSYNWTGLSDSAGEFSEIQREYLKTLNARNFCDKIVTDFTDIYSFYYEGDDVSPLRCNALTSTQVAKVRNTCETLLTENQNMVKNMVTDYQTRHRLRVGTVDQVSGVKSFNVLMDKAIDLLTEINKRFAKLAGLITKIPSK